MADLPWWRDWLSSQPEHSEQLSQLIYRDLQFLILCRKATVDAERDEYSRLLDTSEVELNGLGIPSANLYEFRRRFAALSEREQVEHFLALRRYTLELSEN